MAAPSASVVLKHTERHNTIELSSSTCDLTIHSAEKCAELVGQEAFKARFENAFLKIK